MAKHSFLPGQSGNPAGRPVGARSQFSASFLRDLAASWAQCGNDVLRKVAANDPSRYLAVCSTLIPKDVTVSLEQRLPGGLSADDWQVVTEIMGAIKQTIPDASSRQPGEVLQHTLAALRSYGAKTIEPTPDTQHGSNTAHESE